MFDYETRTNRSTVNDKQPKATRILYVGLWISGVYLYTDVSINHTARLHRNWETRVVYACGCTISSRLYYSVTNIVLIFFLFVGEKVIGRTLKKYRVRYLYCSSITIKTYKLVLLLYAGRFGWGKLRKQKRKQTTNLNLDSAADQRTTLLFNLFSFFCFFLVQYTAKLWTG